MTSWLSSILAPLDPRFIIIQIKDFTMCVWCQRLPLESWMIESWWNHSPNSELGGWTHDFGLQKPRKSWDTVDGNQIFRWENQLIVEVGSLSHYLQGVLHSRWLFGISSINSVFLINRRCWRSEGVQNPTLSSHDEISRIFGAEVPLTKTKTDIPPCQNLIQWICFFEENVLLKERLGYLNLCPLKKRECDLK